MRILRLVTLLFSSLMLPVTASSSALPISSTLADGTAVLIDPDTHVRFYLETDDRHLAAITPAGKLLWNVDLTTESGLERTRPRPVVVENFAFSDPYNWYEKFGPAKAYLSIRFNTMTRAVVSKRDGRLTIIESD
jgi:hypothetical protein